MTLQAASWLILVTNPMTAAMLAWIVVRHRLAVGVGLVTRAFIAIYAIGLLMQAAEQIEFIRAWQQPRATGWMYQLAAQHGIAWSLFFSIAWNPRNGHGGMLNKSGGR